MTAWWFVPSVFSLGAIVWYLVKSHASMSNNPYRWDWAHWIAGLAAGAASAPAYLQRSPEDAALAGLIFFASVWFSSFVIGLFIEEETNWLNPPDDLAPIAARVRGNQTLDDASASRVQDRGGTHDKHD